MSIVLPNDILLYLYINSNALFLIRQLLHNWEIRIKITHEIDSLEIPDITLQLNYCEIKTSEYLC